MLFKKVAEYFRDLEDISSRIEMTNKLSKLLAEVDEDSIDKLIYLIQGILYPDFYGYPELGLGEKLIIKAISMATLTPEQKVIENLYKLGDLGEVIYSLKSSQKSKDLLSMIGGRSESSLTVQKVHEALTKIAQLQGESSRDLKIRLLAGLLKEATPLEAKYIVRFVDGKLRLGVGDATIMDALAIAVFGSDSYREKIERAYNLRADLGNIAKIIKKGGIESLENIKPMPGIPVRPMLAERLSEISEIFGKLGGKFIVEYKYDGERGQIHKTREGVLIYSRRMENITKQYIDVAESIGKAIKAEEAIMEGEIVAVNPDSGELLPFQELMHRKRKHDIEQAIKEYPVNVFLFDLIYLDGEDLTSKPLLIRRKKLESIVSEDNIVRVAVNKEVDNERDFKDFFLKALSEGAEGVMAKAIHDKSIYQAGARGWLWIKFKRDYRSEMVDTVDLVVVGAFYGRGRRGGKFSSLLMASYDPEEDSFYTVCKVASGFSDEELVHLQELVEKYKTQNKDPRVNSIIEPDVWMKPILVAEILGSELTVSPSHTCCLGKVQEGAGISIRFPRFIRWREDKSPMDATTPRELHEMYISQLKKVEEGQIETT